MAMKNIRALVERLKEAAQKEEVRAVIADLESLMDLHEKGLKEGMTGQLKEDMQVAQNRFATSLKSAAFASGMDGDRLLNGSFMDTANAEEKEQVDAIKEELEGDKSSSMKKLKKPKMRG